MKRPVQLASLFAVLVLVSACSGTEVRPFKYVPASDLKPGPGLFTGEEGAWTWGAGDKVPEEWGQDELPNQYEIRKRQDPH
jgi:hypothetical protein